MTKYNETNKTQLPTDNKGNVGVISDLLERLLGLSNTAMSNLLLNSCCVIHIIYAILFFSLDVNLMFVFNCISVVLYIMLRFNVSRIRSTKYVMVLICEIALHSVVATVCVGWDVGFEIYLLGLVPLTFYWTSIKRNYATTLSLIFMVIFIVLRLYCYYNEAFFTISSGVISYNIYIFNSLVGFLMMIYFSVMFSADIMSKQSELNKQNKVLRYLVGVDPLTQLMNRRSMFEKLEECEKARKTGMNFVLSICDIDNFKKVNDTYGHSFGDEVLKTTSVVIKDAVDANTYVCRWGGEEILILFEDLDFDKAVVQVEKIRALIESTTFSKGENSPRITMTFGIAGTEMNNECDFEQIIALADSYLYEGKKNGKNCVVYG